MLRRRKEKREKHNKTFTPPRWLVARKNKRLLYQQLKKTLRIEKKKEG